MFRVELAGIVGVDDKGHFVAPFGEYAFDFTAHFAVSDDCSFHFIPFPAKIRISEGKSKFTCILPSGSIFGAAKDTNLFQN